MSKMVTEAYERDGLRVSPLRDDEKHEWAQPFPGRRRRVGGDRPYDEGTWEQRTTRCGETVYHGRASHDCVREAVAMIERRDGRREPVCAQHLAGAQRSATNDRRKADERRTQADAENDARVRLENIARRLGIPQEDVGLDYHYRDGRWSTSVATVTIDQLDELARRLADGQINT